MEASAVQQLIARRFADVHGAVPASDYRHFCVLHPGEAQKPVAALGFRLAHQGRLFLEHYLDEPIEDVVSERFGRWIGRNGIVEIGAHASERSLATIALWARTAGYLDGIAEVAVAVVTSPLRSMLLRLGVELEQLCEADPRRLPSGGAGWGRYYDTVPAVCAGLIEPARSKLEPWDHSRPSRRK
jgi:thermostable hemolysin